MRFLYFLGCGAGLKPQNFIRLFSRHGAAGSPPARSAASMGTGISARRPCTSPVIRLGAVEIGLKHDRGLLVVAAAFVEQDQQFAQRQIVQHSPFKTAAQYLTAHGTQIMVEPHAEEHGFNSRSLAIRRTGGRPDPVDQRPPAQHHRHHEGTDSHRRTQPPGHRQEHHDNDGDADGGIAHPPREAFRVRVHEGSRKQIKPDQKCDAEQEQREHSKQLASLSVADLI